MKAFLTWHDAAFREVHNLEELGASCIRLDSTLASAVTRVTVLTKYAVRFRYPGAPYEPDVEEAQESLGLALEFMETVLGDFPGSSWKKADERTSASRARANPKRGHTSGPAGYSVTFRLPVR